MADEMYLQKGIQFHRGELVGANSDGELFDGIMVFMIVGLKKVKEDQKEIRKKKEIRKIHDQIRKIHERDQNLQSCLRKAPKLSHKYLHPGNDKINTSFALGIFHETTIAACRSYFPERNDAANFLNLILTWWTISNGNKYNPNVLGNGSTKDDGKLYF